jgi:transcriptional regulator with XRE-family HTH domain
VEDWAAVADAIRKRVDELGWPQGELADRSHVSRATVREVQHHTTERRRSARTLEALSTALGWHPQHVDAVLHGRRPPDLTEPASASGETLPARVDALERHLTEITAHLAAIRADLTKVIDHLGKDD